MPPNQLFSPTYIKYNPGQFLDHDWVNINLFREYLQRTGQTPVPDASSTPSSASVRIKIEARAPLVPDVVKAEPEVITVQPAAGNVKMRTLNEGGREVLELLSESEPDDNDEASDLEVMEVLKHTSRSSSAAPLPPSDLHHFGELQDTGAATTASSDDGDNTDDDDALMESDTVWQDDGTSFVRTGTFRPTVKVTVERMEYRDGPASIYPIPRIPTGFVIDLSKEEYHLRDPKTNELYTIDTIIRNADNDSWETGSGRSAMVTFAPGEAPIACRRARSLCRGCTACDQLDPALRNVVRFELDPALRDAIIIAQQETRRREGNTPEERASIFIKIIRCAKCFAVNSNGRKCEGGPILKAKPQGTSRGHQYFVGCSGWTPKFQKGHRTHSIPDHVNENLVAKALAGLPLAGDLTKDTPLCSAIIHPHTGLKKKYCRSVFSLSRHSRTDLLIHAHIVKGMNVRGNIQSYRCFATRSIYVPKDVSIRKALIIHNDTGHNHPMPTLTKAAFGHKDIYRLLNGKTPGGHAPPLHNTRIKQDILHVEKLKRYPNGLGVDAILPIFETERLTKPLPERYIHSYITTQKGEIIILTFVPYLLKLLDDPGVTSFDGDTTYGGIDGKVNEWELTIFAKLVQRVVRAYITGASADFFESLFNELQRVKLIVTGKSLALKEFIPDGNLLVTNVAMDAAQVIGLCRSVMEYNVPEYSGIPRHTPFEEIAPRFVKICWRHGKEPVHDFRALVKDSDFNRLMDLVHIDSKESLNAFSSFVYGLGIKKITDWWKHKEMHEWIIPCIVRSQSLIPPDIWDSTPSTTNTNEAQHHWTNAQTGKQLTPVEALESRRRVDERVAQEIQMSLQTGILSNTNNEMLQRMARNSQRQSTAARKVRETRDAADTSKQFQLQIDAEVEKNAVPRLQGRIKTTRGRSGAQTTVLPTQSDHVPTIPSAISEPSVTEFDVNTPTASEPSVTEVRRQYSPRTIHRGLHRPGIRFNIRFHVLTSNSTLFCRMSNTLTPYLRLIIVFLAFDPGFLDCGGSAGFGTSVPDSGSMFDNPADDFMDLYGLPTFLSDPIGTSDFSPFAPSDPLPLLPPPPPHSPPGASPAVEEPASSAPKSRRGPRREVDEANIMTSTRSRVPSTRKRVADEAPISNRLPKKGKGRQANSTHPLGMYRARAQTRYIGFY
ncbi:hypothetical protein B0H14DRAFT_3558479 [Mycena olivaceomarginata]|nr:hypothetical protein B0H14DRAFT_3558479 [Mycena olivaceomarginata]